MLCNKQPQTQRFALTDVSLSLTGLWVGGGFAGLT